MMVETKQPVSADDLIDRVWGDRVPHRVQVTLRTYLSRLRRALTVTDHVELVRRGGGYVFAFDSAVVVDLHHFHSLVGQARTVEDDEQSARLLGQALELWRGEPFSGVDTPWFNALRRTLAAERLAAELDHHDLRLRHGQHGVLLAELSTKCAAHPLDERLAGQLMLALYRCGRQADALAHYDRLRRQLIDELGTDLSAPLRGLYQQILTADPALTLPARAGSPRVSAIVPVPRQLPSAPNSFTGRLHELAELTATFDAARAHGATGMVSAIVGAGGIGKTSLGLRWAHDHIDQFPDGQLFIDLRGFTPSARPMAPSAVVRCFLDALGVEPTRIPIDLDAQVGLYRSLIAGKRILIMLDNARDAAQVAPLLPDCSVATVIITSRDRLSGTVTRHGAYCLSLDALSSPDAESLLTHRIGSARIEAEPAAARELLSWCDGLPLAISILAARVNTRVRRPLTMLATELRDVTTRLSALDTGDPTASLSTILSWSHATLDPGQAEVFDMLGLAPGPDMAVIKQNRSRTKQSPVP